MDCRSYRFCRITIAITGRRRVTFNCKNVSHRRSVCIALFSCFFDVYKCIPNSKAPAFVCAYAIPSLMSPRPLIAIVNKLNMVVFEILSGRLAFKYLLFHFGFNRLSRQLTLISVATASDTGKIPSLCKFNRVAKEFINSSKCNPSTLLAPRFQEVTFAWECRKHQM